MRYELNFDEDKIIDIEAIGDNGVLDLKDCCKIMNEQQGIIEAKDSLLSVLSKENYQLRQILKDIIGATDETYTKNKNIYKVTVVLDYEKYREIRRCIE